MGTRVSPCRSVRAPTSSLGLASHTGTTLWASTSCTGHSAAAATASRHSRPSRSGDWSTTTRQGLTLVHFSAQPEPVLSLELNNYSRSRFLR